MLRRARTALIVVGAAAMVVPASASGAVPFVEITSGGPLTKVSIGNSLGCQVAYAGDSQLELYPPSTTPGDCGTFIASAGTLYAPDLNNHGGTAAGSLGARTAFTPVSQSGVTGAGSGNDPKRLVTVVDTGAGLRITETDSYVDGQEAYRTDIQITNTGGSQANGTIYRAGDCFLQESDRGFGFLDTNANAAGCSLNANNSPAARIEQWYPLTPGANYMQDSYSAVWAAIGTKNPFPNTCQCATSLDNGAGISWQFDLAPGASATFSHLTVFSPRGVAGPPPPPSGNTSPGTTSGPLPPAFGPGGVVAAPSNRRCVSRRNFRIRLRNPPGTEILAATVFVNNRRVRTVRNVRVTARVDLRGLPRGRYTVRITILLDDGRTIKGKRRYRTCTRIRRRGRVPRV